MTTHDRDLKATTDQTIGQEEEYDWLRPLGETHARLENDEYTATYTGAGYVTSDYDEGTFLSDMSFAARHGLAATRYWHVRKLEMADLFPEEWRGRAVEYEITVRARRRRRIRRQ